MAETPSPSEVVGRLIEHTAAGRWDQAADLYSDDCVLFHPLAQPTGPRLVGVREHLAGLPAGVEVRDLKIRTTGDPEVVIAEWDYVSDIVETGNLSVVRVRDGKVVSSRDYRDDVTRSWAAGTLGTLLAELGEATDV